MFSSSASQLNKLKTNLRLTVNRLKLLEKKKTEVALKARKEIADYIQAGKLDRARIRVEHIVREDYLVEAMELIEMYCDLLLARFGLVQSQKELDPGLEEAVATLIWVAPRLQSDVAELKAISDQLSKKYSKEFAQACLQNSTGIVSEKVMHKLSVQAPPKVLVEQYMIEIAKSYNIPFEPDPQVMEKDEVLLGDLIYLDNNKGGGSGGGGFSAPMSTGGFAPQSSHGSIPGAPNSGAMVCPPGPYPPNSYPPPPNNYPTKNGNSMGGASAGYPPSNNGGMQQPYPPPSEGGPTSLPPPYTPNNPNAPPPSNQVGFLDLPDLPCVPQSPNSSVRQDKPGSSANTHQSDDVDFDDLSRRFEELKKRK